MQPDLKELQQLSDDDVQRWNAVFQGSRVRSPYLSYAFCRAVHQARGGVRVLRITGNDGETAFLPFQMRKGRSLLRHAEQVGGTMSDYFGIVGAIGNLDANWLLESARLSSLRFDRAVPELTRFRFQEAEEQRCVRVVASDFEAFTRAVAERDKEFVKTVLRSERQLAREHGELAFQLNSRSPAADLEKLITTKRGQYQRTGSRDVLASPWKSDVLYRLLQEPEQGYCVGVLSTLYCGGEWIASNYGLRCGDTLHVAYPVYARSFKRYGPGHILFFRLIERGIRQGITHFDFGPGEAVYKMKYAGETYSLWKGVIRRKSPLGFSERLIQSGQWRAAKFATAWRRLRLGPKVS